MTNLWRECYVENPVLRWFKKLEGRQSTPTAEGLHPYEPMKMLTEEQSDSRKKMCLDLLGAIENDPHFQDSVFTGDET